MFSCFFSCFTKKEPIKKPPNFVELYIEKQKDRFKKLDKDKINSNIEPEFYDLNKYNEIVKEPNNHLELAWKRRILHTSYGRGCLIMFYDPFKQAFSYYCNENLPHNILNAASIEYIKIYHCYDFFMEESYYEEDYKNNLISIHFPEKKSNDKSNKKFDVSKGPFIKRKKTENNSEKKTDDKTDDDKNEEPVKKTPLHINKFVYLGHIRNFTEILSKPVKSKQNFSISSIENMKNTTSWADYKASRKL